MADTARARRLWICYRITEAEYETVFRFQSGRCAGCGEQPRKTRLAVDHCHASGRIRGLLCWKCNKAIGILRDNAQAALNLGEYLKSPTFPVALGRETYGLLGQAKPSKKIKVYGPPVAVVIGKGKPICFISESPSSPLSSASVTAQRSKRKRSR
jgi:hypothetical protein